MNNTNLIDPKEFQKSVIERIRYDQKQGENSIFRSDLIAHNKWVSGFSISCLRKSSLGLELQILAERCLKMARHLKNGGVRYG